MQLGGGAHVRSERGRGAVPQCSVQHRANEYYRDRFRCALLQFGEGLSLYDDL